MNYFARTCNSNNYKDDNSLPLFKPYYVPGLYFMQVFSANPTKP